MYNSSMGTIFLILLVIGVVWLSWILIKSAILLFALNTFLEHFGKEKIPVTLKTLCAITVIREELKTTLTSVSSRR